MMSEKYLQPVTQWEKDPLVKQTSICTPSRDSLKYDHQFSDIYDKSKLESTKKKQLVPFEELDPFVKQVLFEQFQSMLGHSQIADYERGLQLGTQAKLPNSLPHSPSGTTPFTDGYLNGLQGFVTRGGLFIPRNSSRPYSLETLATDEGFQGFRMGMNWERPHFTTDQDEFQSILLSQLKHLRTPTRAESGYQIGFRVKALRDHNQILGVRDVPLTGAQYDAFEMGRNNKFIQSHVFSDLDNIHFENVGRKFARFK